MQEKEWEDSERVDAPVGRRGARGFDGVSELAEANVPVVDREGDRSEVGGTGKVDDDSLGLADDVARDLLVVHVARAYNEN